jgi:hypothetical protein
MLHILLQLRAWIKLDSAQKLRERSGIRRYGVPKGPDGLTAAYTYTFVINLLSGACIVTSATWDAYYSYKNTASYGR